MEFCRVCVEACSIGDGDSRCGAEGVGGVGLNAVLESCGAGVEACCLACAKSGSNETNTEAIPSVTEGIMTYPWHNTTVQHQKRKIRGSLMVLWLLLGESVCVCVDSEATQGTLGRNFKEGMGEVYYKEIRGLHRSTWEERGGVL